MGPTSIRCPCLGLAVRQWSLGGLRSLGLWSFCQSMVTCSVVTWSAVPWFAVSLQPLCAPTLAVASALHPYLPVPGGGPAVRVRPQDGAPVLRLRRAARRPGAQRVRVGEEAIDLEQHVFGGHDFLELPGLPAAGRAQACGAGATPTWKPRPHTGDTPSRNTPPRATPPHRDTSTHRDTPRVVGWSCGRLRLHGALPTRETRPPGSHAQE